MPTVRTLMVIPETFGREVISTCFTKLVYKGYDLVKYRLIPNNEIIRQLLSDRYISGYAVVFRGTQLVDPKPLFVDYYISPNEEDAEKYIKLLFNPEELL